VQVTKYWQFFILRLLTGISVGGAFPLLYSLLGDLFPITERSFVSAFIQIATGLGTFVGQLLSAGIGPATNWKARTSLFTHSCCGGGGSGACRGGAG
jgi:MFS family permease